MGLLDRSTDEIDLGSNHWLRFTCWAPDRKLNPLAHLPDNDHIGGIIRHIKSDGQECQGSIWFDCPQTREVFAGRPLWTVTGLYERQEGNSGKMVTCWDKLTCTPSFLCHCGDHGFVRQGRWVVA